MKNAVTIAASTLIALAATLSSVRAANSINIADAWIQAPMPGSYEAAGYLRITNSGSSDDRLLSVSTQAAGVTEIHEVQLNDGVVSMRPLIYGVKIPAGDTIALSPTTMHLMLLNHKRRLASSKTIILQLNFQNAGTLRVTAPVRALSADGR